MYARIIPTRVGTSRRKPCSMLAAEDHPHACGDKSVFCYRQRTQKGSSPRVWGQAIFATSRKRSDGIIPTRVGTRQIISSVLLPTGDHPHACGDKRQVLYPLRRVRGSSPRVWGQVCSACFWLCYAGIIPTRVGTRSDYRGATKDLRDHPHACGDKYRVGGSSRWAVGSSPRVWGQGDAVYAQSSSSGIIPTRVGTRVIEPCQGFG